MRKLAIMGLSFSGAILLACYLLPGNWLPTAALICVGAGAALLLLRRNWLRGFALAALSCAVGLGGFALHARVTALPAQLLDGQTRTIRAQLLRYPEDYGRYVRAEVRLDTEGLPELHAFLYDNSSTLRGAAPGQWLETEAKLARADRKYGESYRANAARNIYLLATAKGEMSFGVREKGPRFWPTELNHHLVGLVRKLFPRDTAAFMRSLLLGDKTELYQDTEQELAMSRAGLMHVVAVSGMHIAFLVGFLQMLLGRGRLSSLLALGLIWTFVLVTGANPSAVRAGVMQTLLLIAPLVKRENDPITSLSAALSLILLYNPDAAASVGLQLSFASMAGILCFSDKLMELAEECCPRYQKHWLSRMAVSAALNSLAVMPFTIPLMALHFGSIPLLSPLSNLLCMWAVSLCFGGGWLACGVGLLSLRIGQWLGWLLAWPARWILLTARLIGSLSFSALYLQHRLILFWLLGSYALFLGFRFLKGGALRRLALPGLLSALTLVILMNAVRLDYAGGQRTISVLDVGQGQCITVFAGEQTLMIDCGGLGTLDDAGETAGAYLLACGRDRVDALILTHLDTDHCNGVETLMAMRPVKTLILPADADSDNGMRETILAAAKRHNTHIVELAEDSELDLGEIRSQLFAPLPGTLGNDHGIAALVSLGDYDMLVTGDMGQKTEQALLERHPIREAELYIVGHHGSQYASSAVLLETIGADTAIVSCGYNSYGHPEEETLERIASYGYTVYRTDENGRIEIRIGNDYGTKEQRR